MNKHPYGDDLKIGPGRMHESLNKYLEGFDLTPQNILDLVINGVKSAFIPYEYKKWFLRDTKKKAIEMINAYAETT